MHACIDRSGTIEGLEAILKEASAHPETFGVLLLTCDDNGYQPQTIDPLLKQMDIPIAGALFPAVFAGNELLERGSIAISLPTTPQVLSLGGEQQDDNVLRQHLMASGFQPQSTMMVFADGLAFHATRLLDALFDVFGLDIKYLGGGAGSLTLEQRPCLITNNGFTKGGALVVGLDLKCGIGVGHGHTKIGGPHQVTSAKGHKVQTIDWQPAGGYFRELIKRHLPADGNDSGGIVSRNFCLALNRVDGEFVVREAVKVGADDTLEFATEMRENELVDVVMADADRMLGAALGAREGAEKELGKEPQTNLSFDCCARRIYLGDRFDEEIGNLASGGAALFGAITVGGEIANNGESYLDYYNRTCVIGAFEV